MKMNRKMLDQKEATTLLMEIDKGELTCKEIAEKFGVGVGTVYGYIGKMNTRKVKISYKRGNWGKNWDAIAEEITKSQR
jgi:transposase